MSKPLLKETELVIPKLSKTGTHGKHAVFTNPINKKGLFGTGIFETTTETYEIIKPVKETNDPLLRLQSPALLAFRKSTRPISRVNSRPSTSLIASAAQMMPSLITNKPLSNLKEAPVETEAIKKETELEEMSISFKEDPIAYFSKRKDGRGHRFIYMIHTGSRKDLDFNPYDLKKVPSIEIGNEYFTMSASGVTHVKPDGTTENVTLDTWSKESSIFMAVRKLKTFALFLCWKPFRIWKKFVMRQRFYKITDQVLVHSFFNNFAFYESTIGILRESADNILMNLLLSFNTMKMYPLDEFRSICDENIELLKQKYQVFIENIVTQVIQLDEDIRDPQRVVVEDSDFPEIKRKNPNLGQLMILERKKYAEKNRRNDVVKIEIGAFGEFVRLIDYILLEQLAKSCLESWYIADCNISTDKSSIFQIQVSFSDEGEIVFIPSLSELIETVDHALKESLSTLNSLPRIIRAGPIREHLKESIPNLSDVFEDGPSFKSFTDCNVDIKNIRKHILDVLTYAYEDAYQTAQQFKEYFPIYQIGKSWSPQIYLKERGGDAEDINLAYESQGEFIFSPSKELIIDFAKIREDFNKFKEYDIKMNQFRSCTLRGALYVDSKSLRSHLKPIPQTAQFKVQQMLKDLVINKVKYFQKIFAHCSKNLNKVPTNLSDFVDFYEFSKNCKKLEPHIATEIKFIDALFFLFEEFKITSVEEYTKNPLHAAFSRFKEDQNSAKATYNIHNAVYINSLNNQIRNQLDKLNRINNTVNAIPVSIQQCEVDSYIPAIEKVEMKIMKYEPNIINLTHYQKVLEVNNNNFSIFSEIKQKAEFDRILYQAVASWKELKQTITTYPIVGIIFKRFKKDLLDLDGSIKDLMKMAKEPVELLNELKTEEGSIFAHMEAIELLCNGKMQAHHWNTLFEQCGCPNAYYSQIRIDELISLGVLDKIENIREITTTSNGESSLEAEFQELNSHWEEINLPIIDTEDKDDNNLTLGSLDTLFSQISDTQLKLDNMLNIHFAQGIKENILCLSTKLENAARILDEWIVFQSNWPLLTVLFSHEDIKNYLPAYIQKFNMIRKRWESLVSKTKENTLLFSVCGFPNLLEMLKDNNSQISQILSSIMKYIDAKREEMPRLYFLSNQEILQMITTKEFSVFNHHISKMFMHINVLDSHVLGDNDVVNPEKTIQTSAQNFSGHIINGMIGDEGDTISFTKPVQITGNIEKWGNEVINAMKTAVKDTIGSSIARYTSSNMKDWISTVSTYIALLTLQISFAREIHECFNNTDKQTRAFAEYETLLQSKIVEISSVMNSPLLSPTELLKLSSVSAFINYQASQVKAIAAKYHNYSQELNWKDHLKFKYDQQGTLLIEMGDTTVEHGYEFWGSSTQFIHTQASERVLNSAAEAIINNKFPMICGASTLGKKHLISQLAALFGKYVFFVPAFQETPISLLTRVVNGAALSGCWLSFNNVDKLTHSNLSFICNIIRSISSLQTAGGSRISISGKIVELQKSTRILLSGNYKFLESTTTPPELRTILKPVMFAAPDCLQIANIKLISAGFKFTKVIATKMYSLITTITRTFEYLKNKSFISYVFVILDDAHNLLRQILHQKSADFLDYYNEPRTAEEFVVARAVYTRFMPCIRPQQQNLLIKLIFADFHLFEKFDVFKDHLMNPNCFIIEQAAQYIRETLEKELNDRKNEINVDYIIDQVINLYWMMLKFPAIIISGPPNSGKTLVVEMLQKAFEVLSQNPDIMNRFQGIDPIKVVDVYHESETYKSMFGSLKETDEFGSVQQYGVLNTYLSQLKKFEKSHHCLLRFNGPMTPQFVSYIEELFSTDISHKCKLNTMDTIQFGQKFNIIIETGNLSCISPSCVALCGILPMKCKITKEMLFTQSISKENVSNNTKNVLKKYFVNAAEKVVNFIEQNNGIIPGLKDNMKKFLLKDSLLRKSINYACDVIKSNNVPKDDEEALRTTLLHSIYTIMCGIITKECATKLDKWMIEEFGIITPNGWDGYSIPDNCKEMYKEPSLESTKIHESHLIPLDFSLTKEQPVYSTKGLPFQSTVEDASICTPEILPDIHEFNVLLMNKENIFLHGAQGSGKTAFLRQVFSRQKDFVPIFIPVTITATGRTLLSFIKTHTPVVTKNYAMMKSKKTYALIFEDVPPTNFYASEFIRQIVEQKKVIVSSKIDQKYFEEYPIRNSVVIVTSRSPNQFGRRFMNNLYPVYLTNPTPVANEHIFNILASNYQFSEEFQTIFKLFIKKLHESKLAFNELQLIQVFPFISQRTSVRPDDIASLIAALIEQAKFVINPKTAEEEEKYKNVVKEVFKSYKDIIDEYNNKFIFKTQIECSEDLSSIKATIVRQNGNEAVKELNEALEKANKESKEFICIPFNTHIVKQFLKINRAFNYPGGSAFLTGSPSSTRRSLVRLFAIMKNMNFVEITDLPPVEQYSSTKRIKVLKEKMRSVIHDALIDNRSSIVFMRAEECNQEEQRMLNYFLHRLNFSEFYNPGSLDKLYKDYMKAKSIPKDQDMFSLYSKIKIILRHRIHICITTEVEETRLNFAHVYAINFPQESCVEESIIRRMPEYPQYAQLFVNIHNYASDKFPELIAPNIMNDLTNIFEISVRRREELNKVIHEQRERAKKFFDDVSDNLKKLTEKIEGLTPQLTEITEHKKTRDEKYAEKKRLHEEKIASLDKEESDKRTEISNIKNQIEEQQEIAKKALEDSSDGKRKIGILTDKDLSVLQIPADNPPIKLKIFIRVLLVLCNLDPTYEVDGKKLLMRNDLFKYLTTTIVPTEVDSEISLKACQAFHQGSLTLDDMESISPTAGTLFRWTNSVIEYLNAENKAKILTKELKQKEVDLEIYLQEVKPQREEEAKIQTELVEEAAAIEKQDKDQAEFENTFKECSSQQKILKSILSDGDKFINRIVTDVDLPENATISDSIFLAAYKAYSGYFDQEQLNSFFVFIKELIQKENLEISGKDPEFISAYNIFLGATEIKMHNDSINFSFQTEVAVYNAIESTRIPLILDQDGFVTEKLEKIIGSSVVHLSAQSSMLEEQISLAMHQGDSVILHDVDSYNQMFEGLFAFYASRPGIEPKEVCLGKTVILANGNFKIYFVTTKMSPKDIPYDLLSRTRLINGNIGSLDTAYLEINREFVNFISRPNVKNVKSEKLTELKRNIEVSKKVEKILEMLTNYTTEDYEKLEEIAKEKKKLLFIINEPALLQSDIEMLLFPIDELIKPVKGMWACLSNVMPRIVGSNYYRLSQFISSIQNGINSSGIRIPPIPEGQFPNFKSAVISSILKFVLTPFKVSEALIFMFFTSLILRYKDKLITADDINKVIEHVANSLTGKCDVSANDTFALLSDAVDGIKTASINNIFSFITKGIAEEFTNKFDANLPIFTMESFVQTSSANPVFIISDIHNDPTSLLENFVASRNRFDSFESFSLTDDPESLKKIVRFISSVVNKGQWIALHYSNPSPAAASALIDVYQAIINGSLSANFRLIVIAQSQEFIPPFFLRNCTRYSYNTYPSVRQQMLQIYNHYYNSIRSSTSTRAIKKFSYAAALMYSVINFRNSLGPIGFSCFTPISELNVKMIIEQLRNVIDNNQNGEIPIRNVRDHIQDLFLTGSTLDTFDRRKLRVHIFSIFSAESMDDSFSFVKPNSEEIEMWTIPQDAPITNYSHMISKLPVFNTCDVLIMEPSVSSSIRGWYLGKMVAEPISLLLQKHPRDLALQRINNFIANLPKVKHFSMQTTPTMQWARNEIYLLNKAIKGVTKELQNPTKLDLESFESNVLPKHIIDSFNYSGAKTPETMSKHIIEKMKFLQTWMEEGMPCSINVNYVNDLDGLILAFHHEIANRKNLVVDSLMLDYQFGNQVTSEALVLTDIHIMAGNWDSVNKKLISSNDATKPFTAMPQLTIKPTYRIQREGKVFMCPLFKSSPSSDLCTASDSVRTDGEAENFIRYIPISTEVSDKYLVASGTAFVCHIPEEFH